MSVPGLDTDTLLQQLSVLQSKNKELQAAVRSKDAELQAALSSAASDAGSYASPDAQAAKIIDLSKKNRALQLALDKERQKYTKLAAEKPPQRAPQSVDAQQIQMAARSVVEQAAESAEAAHREAASLKTQVAQQLKRIGELENRAFMMEIENKKLTRALQREVGDDVPLEKVLEDGTSWKGRHEKMIALQEKLRALQLAQGTAQLTKPENRQKDHFERINKERHNELEWLRGELQHARGVAEHFEGKYKSQASRTKNLETMLADLKAKMQVLLEKSKSDDKLIGALRSEVGKARPAGAATPGGTNAAPPDSRGSVFYNQFDRAAASGTATPMSMASTMPDPGEVQQLRQRLAEQADQIEKQQKIIGYLQVNQAAMSSMQPAPTPGDRVAMAKLEAENANLSNQLSELAAELAAAEQRVAALEMENENLQMALAHAEAQQGASAAQQLAQSPLAGTAHAHSRPATGAGAHSRPTTGAGGEASSPGVSRPGTGYADPFSATSPGGGGAMGGGGSRPGSRLGSARLPTTSASAIASAVSSRPGTQGRPYTGASSSGRDN